MPTPPPRSWADLAGRRVGIWGWGIEGRLAGVPLQQPRAPLRCYQAVAQQAADGRRTKPCRLDEPAVFGREDAFDVGGVKKQERLHVQKPQGNDRAIVAGAVS